MPCQTIEYRQHLLLPAQSGRQWTVLIRQPDQVTYHPEIATGENYREAVWRAERIVDGICERTAARAVAV